MLPYPTIFVPGITASYLKDYYDLPPQVIWSVVKKKYERISLHPDNLNYELRQPALVREDQIFEIAYEELIDELRAELSDEANAEVPVYPFSYDWRQPLGDTQQRLADFVQQVTERTRLLPHYRGKPVKVNLVGHSMGGLVIARYLHDQADPQPVNKVISLASPFQGSVEAVAEIAIGVGNISSLRPKHSKRRAARVTPALYQLLPTFNGAVNADSGLSKEILNRNTWQESILNALTEYVERAGSAAANPKEKARSLLNGLLRGARDNKKAIEDLDLARHGLTQADWLAVVGVNSKTRTSVALTLRDDLRRFIFEKTHVADDWLDIANWQNTGDGTVPFKGAVPPFLSEDRLVLITPDDYGFWEIGDEVLSKVGGFHGILPNMNLVQRMIIQFFTDPDKQHGATWGRRVPGVVDWQPPLELDERSDHGPADK